MRGKFLLLAMVLSSGVVWAAAAGEDQSSGELKGPAVYFQDGMDRLHKDNRILVEEQARFDKAAASLEEEQRRVSAETVRLEQELAVLDRQAGNRKGGAAGLEAAVARDRASAEALKAERQELERRSLAAQADAQRLSDEADRVRADARDIRSGVAAAAPDGAAVVDLRRELETVEKSVADARQEWETLRAALAELEMAGRTGPAQVAVLTREQQALQAQAAQLAADATEIEQQLAGETERLPAPPSGDLKALEGEVAALVEERARLDRAVVSGEKTLASRTSRSAAVARRRLEKRLQDLEARYRAMTAEAERLRRDMIALDKRKTQMERDVLR